MSNCEIDLEWFIKPFYLVLLLILLAYMHIYLLVWYWYNPQRNWEIIVDKSGIELASSRLGQNHQLSVVLLVRFMPQKSEIVSKPLCQWASCQIRKIAGAHAPGMPGTFSPSPQVSDPDMHHGTCVTHVPWCMPGSLTSGILWNRQWGKRSRHSWRMRNLQFYVSGKRPMAWPRRH